MQEFGPGVNEISEEIHLFRLQLYGYKSSKPHIQAASRGVISA
jgi:hypothetical protein